MRQNVSKFRDTIENAYQKLAVISDAEASLPLAAGKWSAKQVIGHLIDSASNNHGRFVRAQFKDDLVFEGYDQEQWVDAQNYNAASWL
jgi:hypothetical protein